MAHTLTQMNMEIQDYTYTKINMVPPIIDPSTLTEEQREEIKDKYEKTPNPYDHQFNAGIGEGWLEAIEWLFGENFFQKGE